MEKSSSTLTLLFRWTSVQKRTFLRDSHLMLMQNVGCESRLKSSVSRWKMLTCFRFRMIITRKFTSILSY
jgi:hypothetical protein